MENVKARCLRPGDRVDTEPLRSAAGQPLTGLDRTRLAVVQDVRVLMNGRVRLELDLGGDVVVPEGAVVSVAVRA